MLSDKFCETEFFCVYKLVYNTYLSRILVITICANNVIVILRVIHIRHCFKRLNRKETVQLHLWMLIHNRSRTDCKLPTRLGETGKLRRGSNAQVGGDVRDSADVCWEWRRGLGAGFVGWWGMGDREYLRQHTLRYVEWLIRWNNRLSSAASDGTDGRGVGRGWQIGRRRDGVGFGERFQCTT